MKFNRLLIFNYNAINPGNFCLALSSLPAAGLYFSGVALS